MAVLGLALAFLFLIVTRGAATTTVQTSEQPKFLPILHELLTTRAIGFAMLGSGLQLFAFAGFLAWTPRWLELTYRLSSVEAAKGAVLLVFVGTMGMSVCSILADRLALRDGHGRARAATLFCAVTGLTFAIGFALAPGPLQLLLVGLGVFTGGAAVGPGSAILAHRLRPAIHGVAFSCGTVANNLIGQGPAPWAVGRIADASSLPMALSLSSIASLLGCLAFFVSTIERTGPLSHG